jgi:hypothetical protein
LALGKKDQQMTTDLNLPGFGQLTKVLRPRCKYPRWVWTINGHDVEFTTTQVMSYTLVFRQCVRHQLQANIHLNLISPDQVTKEQWRCFLNRAMKPIRDALA